MVVFGTDVGGNFGAGYVIKRWRGMQYAPPNVEDIPYGCWAEKSPKSEYWDIYCGKETRY